MFKDNCIRKKLESMWIEKNMNPDISSKVIGYFAFKSPTQVICDGDACVIAGSEQRMKEYIGLGVSESSGITTIKKTRFGFKLKEEDFSDKAETGLHFVVIALQELEK